MLFSSFGLKTKLNGQDRLTQDQDLKKMVLRPVLRPSSLLYDFNFTCDGVNVKCADNRFANFLLLLSRLGSVGRLQCDLWRWNTGENS